MSWMSCSSGTREGRREASRRCHHHPETHDSGLYDESRRRLQILVTRDWRTPHFEKMLETNLGFLRNAVHAYMLTAMMDSLEARGDGRIHTQTSGMMLGRVLREPGCHEEYYALELDARSAGEASVDRHLRRMERRCPATMLVSGMLLGERGWVDAGLKAWRTPSPNSGTQVDACQACRSEDLYLFEDQVSFLNALIASSTRPATSRCLACRGAHRGS